MTKTSGQLPAISVLVKFECVGRLGSLTLAAQELRSSVSAVSRCMNQLEKHVGVPLLERVGGGTRLTEAGLRYHGRVASALGELRSAAEEAAESARSGVVIACSHDTSHLVLMPRFGELEAMLGVDARVRLLTYQRHVHELRPFGTPDVVLSWRESSGSEADQALVFREEMQPVCSPAYLAAHEEVLRGPGTGWGGLTLLDLIRPNMGWATWDDWFAGTGHPACAPRREDYDTYTQILEAAAAGRGVALGWKHLIEGYLERGDLVPVHGEFVPFGGCYIARLTSKGQRNALGSKCLRFFETFSLASRRGPS